jgi:hypothetical protein
MIVARTQNHAGTQRFVMAIFDFGEVDQPSLSRIH